MTSLREDTVIYADNTYRRQTKFVMLATIQSLVPKGYVLDPSIYGGGNSEFTWGRVQKFFSRYPGARRYQQPMHWYTEFVQDDYVTYVGLPETNKSWWMQEMVQLGALRPEHADSLLIVLQENYNVDTMEKRLWQHLAHQVVSPLLRDYQFDRSRVLFFERVANRDAVYSRDYPYLFAEPQHLDELQLELTLKEYGKR